MGKLLGYVREQRWVQESVNLAGHGLTVGDRQEIHSDILDTAHHVVGTSDIDCGITSVRTHGFSAVCTSTLVLPGGSLTATFGGAVAAINAQAVTGGTGRFEGSRGELRATGPEGRYTPFVVDLLPI